MAKNKRVIIIAGPTASGKTALSLRLAKHFSTSVISADSRQCFKELNIGVAKPTTGELASVQHYFVSSHSIKNEVNAAMFEEYALKAAEEILKDNDVAVMVGGTGLYIKAFCEGLDQIPVIPNDIREKIIGKYQQLGIEFLQNELEQKDPLFFATSEKQNPQRLMRALEVFEATGKSISSFQSLQKKKRDFDIVKIAIELPKEKLHENINTRVDEMIKSGLVEEVNNLLPYKNLNALQTVGYKEIFNFLEKKISLQKAVEQIKISTRQYAKRQLTWFKKDPDIQWISELAFQVSDFFEL